MQLQLQSHQLDLLSCRLPSVATAFDYHERLLFLGLGSKVQRNPSLGVCGKLSRRSIPDFEHFASDLNDQTNHDDHNNRGYHDLDESKCTPTLQFRILAGSFHVYKILDKLANNSGVVSKGGIDVHQRINLATRIKGRPRIFRIDSYFNCKVAFWIWSCPRQ